MKARQLYIYGLITLLTILPQDSDEIIAIQEYYQKSTNMTNMTNLQGISEKVPLNTPD